MIITTTARHPYQGTPDAHTAPSQRRLSRQGQRPIWRALVLVLLICPVVHLWGGLGSSAIALPCPLPDQSVHSHAHRHSAAAPLHQHAHPHLWTATAIPAAAPHADATPDHHPPQPGAVIPEHPSGERVVLHASVMPELEPVAQLRAAAAMRAPGSWQGVPPTPPPRSCT